MAEALYRKYRPQVFEDVVGQEPIERTLKNAIAQDKVSHAYLFTGPRGTGKTTTARLLAKALLCQSGPTPDPDGTCEDCQLIAEGAHPDVYELDAASRTGVENVREEIISRVSFAPTRGRYKVYIIDEVHMLSTAAFNALLKTLEEPPSHVVFVLCTTDPQKVPETIHSRCQRFDFRRIAPESMVSRLGAICIAENVEFEGEALDLIAHRAEGGLRNALTSLEQIIAFENGRVTLSGAERLLGSIDSNDMAEILSYIGKRDVANCFKWTASYVETGADLAQFVRDMAEHVRNMYIMALVGDDVDLEVTETVRHELAGELQWFGPDRLARLMGVLGDLISDLKTSSNPRLAFEIALTRMVRPDSDLTIEALAERVEALESGYSAVAHVMPGAAVPGAGTVAGVMAPDTGMAMGAVADTMASGATTLAARTEQAVFDPLAGDPVYGQGGVASGGAVGRALRQTRLDSAASQVGETPAREAALAGGRAPAREAASVESQAFAASQAPAASAVPAREQRTVPAEAQPANASPAQAPIAPAPGSAAPFENPASLQRIWQATLSAVKKQKQAYGVLFMGTKVRFDAAAGMVKIGFPAENAFAYNAVQKPDVQEALGAALVKAAGMSVAFAFERIGEETSAATSGPQQQQAAQPSGAREQSQSALRVGRQVMSDSQATPQQQAAQSAPQQQTDSQSRAVSQSAVQFTHQQPAIDDEAARARRLDSAHRESQGFGFTSQPKAEVEPVDAGYRDDRVPYEDLPYDPVPYDDYDTATSVSPAEPNLTPDGAIAENPADLEAMLQAGFGGGVVFQEVSE